MQTEQHKVRNRRLGEQLVKALEQRQFTAYYREDGAGALELAKTLIPPDDTVAFGGSVTAAQMGLAAWVRDNRKIVDRDAAKTPEERAQKMRESLLCDTYITGTNALTYDGILVNIDGNGNRVAAMTYGPRRVLVCVSLQKAMPDLPSAILRARNEAAPINKQRFGGTAPCLATGRCGNCNAPDCICNYFSVIRRCNPPGKITVLLIGEPLGF